MKLIRNAIRLPGLVLAGLMLTVAAGAQEAAAGEPPPAAPAAAGRFLAMFRGGERMGVSEADVVDSADFRAGYLADLVFDLTNRERARHGLPRLSRSAPLEISASVSPSTTAEPEKQPSLSSGPSGTSATGRCSQ